MVLFHEVLQIFDQLKRLLQGRMVIVTVVIEVHVSEEGQTVVNEAVTDLGEVLALLDSGQRQQ